MLAMPSGGPDDPPRSGDAVPSLVPPCSRALRVLVVDDHEDSRELFREVLELAGHTATGAGDGEHALALLLDGGFDVALLDLDLPLLGGAAIAQRAREALNESSPLLVAITGSPRRANDAAALFDVYLLKPVEIDDLLAVVARTPPVPPR